MKKVVRIATIIYGILGLLIGVGMFIYSLNNSDFTFFLDETEIRGVWSGVIAIFFVPILMCFVGAIHGIMFWFPIIYIYRKLTNNTKTKELK